MQKIEEIIVVEGRDDTAAIRQAVDAVTIETHGFGIRAETWTLIEKAYRTKGIIVFTDPDTAGEQIRRRILERFPESKEAFLDRDAAEKDGDIGIENASPEDIRAALAKVHAAKAGNAAPASALERISSADRADNAGDGKLHDASGSEDAADNAMGEARTGISGEADCADNVMDDARADASGVEDAAADNAVNLCDDFTADDLFRWGLDGMPGAAQRRREVGKRLGIGQATSKTFLKRLNRFGITREEIEAAIRDLWTKN